jgi:hypothetical protein
MGQAFARDASKVCATARTSQEWKDSRIVPLALDVPSASSIDDAVLAAGDVSIVVNNASAAAFWSATNSLRLELAPNGTQVTGLHLRCSDTSMAAGVEVGEVEVLADPLSVAEKANLAAPIGTMYPQLAVCGLIHRFVMFGRLVVRKVYPRSRVNGVQLDFGVNVKSPLRILTATAVSAALVAGGIAGAAPALAADPVAAAGSVSIDNGAVSMSSFDKPVVNLSIAGDGSYVHFWVFKGGAWTETYKTFVYNGAGAPTTTEPLDIAGALAGSSSAYNPTPSGSYPIHLTVDAFTDYTNNVYTSYAAAQSPDYVVNVSKLPTKITGWKTKSKSAKHGKDIKISSPVIYNAGSSAKWVFQYKKKGSKTWHTSESGTLSYTVVAKQKFKTHAFNTIKHKIAKRGSYYFRFMVKDSAFITGAVTKQIKLTWK